MNFHKNYYKCCLPSLFISLAIMLVGIAMSLILGYNTSVATPYALGGLVFYIGLLFLCISVFEIIYFKLRYNWSTGFVIVLKNFVDAILLFSIIAIVRIPLTLSTFIASAFGLILGNITSLILLNNANNEVKNQSNYVKFSNDFISNNILGILILSSALLLVMAVLIGTTIPSLIGFALAGVVAVIINALTSVFLLVPIWIGFMKREFKLKNKVVVHEEQVLENNDNATVSQN